MHDASQFLANLAVVLGVAAIVVVVFHRLHQPIVLGYLLAGLIIGPHIPIPLVADESMIHTLSELGVILLMFSLGLDFNLRKLASVGPTAAIIAVLQCSLMIWLGYITGIAFGWTSIESLYAGAIVAISSTTIIVKAFDEQHIKGTVRELVFGVLIVEDIVAILLLAILTTISSGTGLSAGEFGWTVFRLGAFLLGLMVVGLLVVPPAVRLVVRLERPEITVVSSIGFCFAVALLAERAGYSVALGAFLAGALVAESGVEATIEHLVEPIRDIFAAVFFVAVGMSIDPVLIAQNWQAVLAVTAIVVVGMVTSVTLGAFFTGYGVRTSVQAGMSMAQIGEFSFIIAGVGLTLGATRSFLYPIAVAVSAITTLITPWLIRWAGPVSVYVDRRLPRPLQTIAALYGTWLENLRGSFQGETTWHRIRRTAIWLLLDELCLAAVIISAALFMERLTRFIHEQTGLPDSFATAIVIVAAAIIALPLGVGIVRGTKALGLLLANQALPVAPQGKLDRAAAPRRAFVFAVQFGLLLLMVMPLVAITQPFLPPAEGAVLIACILALLAFGFWRTATNLQGHVQAGSQMIVQLLTTQAASADDQPVVPFKVVEEVLPGLGTPIGIRIGPGSAAVGKTLVELDLRGKTGATVLAIARGAEGFLPTGKERLQESDILVVAGTRDSIEAAKELLAGRVAAAGRVGWKVMTRGGKLGGGDNAHRLRSSTVWG